MASRGVSPEESYGSAGMDYREGTVLPAEVDLSQQQAPPISGTARHTS